MKYSNMQYQIIWTNIYNTCMYNSTHESMMGLIFKNTAVVKRQNFTKACSDHGKNWQCNVPFEQSKQQYFACLNKKQELLLFTVQRLQ